MSRARVVRAACTAAGLLVALQFPACSRERDAREIHLIARGMTFLLAAEPDTPNPVIQLRAGERIRLVLENDAPGLLHDFQIPAWGVEVPQIRAGEQAEVTFTVPDTPGTVEYRCRPHAELMSGKVEVGG